jgi:hypothetical protein
MINQFDLTDIYTALYWETNKQKKTHTLYFRNKPNMLPHDTDFFFSVWIFLCVTFRAVIFEISISNIMTSKHCSYSLDRVHFPCLLYIHFYWVVSNTLSLQDHDYDSLCLLPAQHVTWNKLFNIFWMKNFYIYDMKHDFTYIQSETIGVIARSISS